MDLGRLCLGRWYAAKFGDVSEWTGTSKVYDEGFFRSDEWSGR